MESQFDFGGEEVRGAELPDDDGNEQEEAKEEGSGDEMVLGVGDILNLPASLCFLHLRLCYNFLLIYGTPSSHPVFHLCYQLSHQSLCSAEFERAMRRKVQLHP